MIVSVVTLGCKVNQCESAAIVDDLNAKGYQASEGLFPADVYVLNTCSVTAEADRKSRQYIGKMQKLNSGCKIVVVGCSSQNDPTKFKCESIAAIGGTSNKVDFAVNAINKIFNNNYYSIISDRIDYQDMVINGYYHTTCSMKTRHFVKIQDGCDRFCSYCIIPYLRGRNKSRSIDDILRECGSCNSEEIVLTGIDISSYGRDMGKSLIDLLNALSTLPMRKRMGSFECEIIDDALLSAMVSSGFCPHFHMSLQSGSDSVLRDMNRHYNTEFYYAKTELIRKYFPKAGIMTDIIVGFPTETDECFEQTISFARKCRLADIHVFPYSSRSGTLATKKYTPIQKIVMNDRVKRMTEIKHELHTRFLTENLNSVMSVYVEDREDGYNVGYTPNYIKVYSDAPCGKIADLRLTEIYKDGIIGVRDF